VRRVSLQYPKSPERRRIGLEPIDRSTGDAKMMPT
jgi:hypothetical protein